MVTFQTVVSEALDATDAELESLVVAEEGMSLDYRVRDGADTEGITERVATIASAFLLAVRDGAGRPELTVHVYRGEDSIQAASYCIDADWARACVVGDVDRSEYLQQVLDTFASREQRAAGKVSFARV